MWVINHYSTILRKSPFFAHRAAVPPSVCSGVQKHAQSAFGLFSVPSALWAAPHEQDTASIPTASPEG